MLFYYSCPAFLTLLLLAAQKKSVRSNRTIFVIIGSCQCFTLNIEISDFNECGFFGHFWTYTENLSFPTDNFPKQGYKILFFPYPAATMISTVLLQVTFKIEFKRHFYFGFIGFTKLYILKHNKTAIKKIIRDQLFVQIPYNFIAKPIIVL